jgi:hypothetical protein
MGRVGAGHPVAYHDGNAVWPLTQNPGRCGVFVASVFDTAIGDQRDCAQRCLVAIRRRASVAADGAVLVKGGRVAAVGARSLGFVLLRYGDSANLRQRGAAALAESVCASHGRSALRTRGLIGHTRVLGRISFAFSTKAMRSHMSVDSCASSR